jgi:hypothetical protein
MTFYIAAHSRNYAVVVKSELERRGHRCTSRWIVDDTKFGTGEYSDAERQRLALLDEEDVRGATDGLILLAEAKGQLVPGGKHVETGMALALGRRVYVIGERENMFHWHPMVRVFSEIDRFWAFLESHTNAPGDDASPTKSVDEEGTSRRPPLGVLSSRA